MTRYAVPIGSVNDPTHERDDLSSLGRREWCLPD